MTIQSSIVDALRVKTTNQPGNVLSVAVVREEAATLAVRDLGRFSVKLESGTVTCEATGQSNDIRPVVLEVLNKNRQVVCVLVFSSPKVFYHPKVLAEDAPRLPQITQRVELAAGTHDQLVKLHNENVKRFNDLRTRYIGSRTTYGQGDLERELINLRALLDISTLGIAKAAADYETTKRYLNEVSARVAAAKEDCFQRFDTVEEARRYAQRTRKQ